MAANLIATILVIAIHYDARGTETVRLNYLFQEFLINGIARVAVPFFAMMSGYFMAMTLNKKTYTEMLFNKSKTLLIPYLVASLFILLALNVIGLFFQQDASQVIPIKWYIETIFLHPLSIQFWYLRDVIILTIFSPLLIGIGQNKRILLVLVTGFLWLIDYQPFPIIVGWYLLNIETLFFFMLGGILFGKNALLPSIMNASRRHIIIVLAFWFLLLAIRIYIDPTLDVWYVKRYTLFSILLYKLAILVGICSIMQLSTRFYMNKHVIYLSGLTFFAYLFHLVPLSYFMFLTDTIVTQQYSFYLNFPIALIAVFALAHIVYKLQPKAFAFITGGRNPDKWLKRTV